MTDHPLTEARASELWDNVPDSVYVHDFDAADREIQDHTTVAMQAAYAAGRADATDDTDDGWEPFDWDENPARIGDEVEVTYDKLYGVSYVKSGVIVSFHSDGDPCAMTDRRGLIGGRGDGTWRVRRKRLDPLADLTPGTIIRDVTIMGLKEHCDAFILSDASGPYVATAYGFYLLPFLTAFTTDDRTIRYTRNGDTWTAEILEGATP